MSSHTLGLLRQNDPLRKEIEIFLDSHEHSDAAIAQALEQNQFISCLSLHTVGVDPAQRNMNWENLCCVLATRGNLVRFILNEFPEAQVNNLRRILQAIQQNSSVRVVELEYTALAPEDLCSFLATAVHVAELTLRGCGLLDGEQSARDVAAALQRNTNIVTLTLCNVDAFLDPIFEGLVLNTCVRNLTITTNSLPQATSNALQVLLESTRSVQHLELSGMILWEESAFHPVAQGLINGRTVTDIALKSCSLLNDGPITLLNQILERKRNLRALVMINCFFGTFLQQFLPALFSTLRRLDSPLRHLHIEELFSQTLPDQSFRALLEAVAESKLESFAFGIGGVRSRLPMLEDAIPSMKIRELVIFEYPGPHFIDVKQTLRRAVKQNFTLQSVKYSEHRFGNAGGTSTLVDGSDDDDDDETLKFYTMRNTRLAEWVEDPSTVPQHLWKQALALATKAGPEIFFRLLRKVGPEVLPVRPRHKRKRSEEVVGDNNPEDSSADTAAESVGRVE